MESNISKISDTLKAIFDFDVTRRIFFFAGIAASIAVGVSLYQMIQEPIYQPLPYSINEHNFTSIIDTLEKSHIEYKINDQRGTISVPSKSIHLAKIKLSSAGIQKDDEFSFSFLNEQNKLGTSQFLENARFIRALESDLAKTIRAIQGINKAKVNLAIPQRNIFADENAKAKASVVINVSPGYDSDKEKVRAIIRLVAASVPELDPKNVAITDQYGHYLSSMLDQNSILNQEQLNYQNKVQRYYEKRIASLITPILGENKASIIVHANLDFTQSEEAREAYDPEKKTLRSEQNMNESNSTPQAGGVPGAATNQPNAPQPQGANQDNPNQKSRTESVKNYEVSKTMKYVKTANPSIRNISAAVILDDEAVYDPETKKTTGKPLSKEKIEKITELIKSSIGFNNGRGDRATVINSPFIPHKIAEIPEAAVWEEPWFWEWVKRSSGIIAGFVFLFLLYRHITKEVQTKKTKPETIELKTDPNQPIAVTSEMIKLKNEQITILKEMATKDPNKVANIIKKWVTK